MQLINVYLDVFNVSIYLIYLYTYLHYILYRHLYILYIYIYIPMEHPPFHGTHQERNDFPMAIKEFTG